MRGYSAGSGAEDLIGMEAGVDGGAGSREHMRPLATGGRIRRTVLFMCRSIKTLREPYASDVTDDDVRAAALQYVRKISGFRAPSARNAEAFERAVDAISAATRTLLDDLELKHVSRAASGGDQSD
jgi:hypothetical protein